MRGILNKISKINFSVEWVYCLAVMQTISSSMTIKNIDKMPTSTTRLDDMKPSVVSEISINQVAKRLVCKVNYGNLNYEISPP